MLNLKDLPSKQVIAELKAESLPYTFEITSDVSASDFFRFLYHIEDDKTINYFLAFEYEYVKQRIVIYEMKTIEEEILKDLLCVFLAIQVQETIGETMVVSCPRMIQCNNERIHRPDLGVTPRHYYQKTGLKPALVIEICVYQTLAHAQDNIINGYFLLDEITSGLIIKIDRANKTGQMLFLYKNVKSGDSIQEETSKNSQIAIPLSIVYSKCPTPSPSINELSIVVNLAELTKDLPQFKDYIFN